MSELIKEGDLVMYRYSCCLGYRDGVEIFQVGDIRDWGYPHVICHSCKSEVPTGASASRGHGEYGAPLQWLKRIPPLSELEGEKTKEDIREHA